MSGGGFQDHKGLSSSSPRANMQRAKPTKWFGRRLSVSIACLFWTRRRQQAAPRASSGRGWYRPLPPRDGRRRCDGNLKRAPRICARLHNPTPSCARSCCHCTQPCLCAHVVDRTGRQPNRQPSSAQFPMVRHWRRQLGSRGAALATLGSTNGLPRRDNDVILGLAGSHLLAEYSHCPVLLSDLALRLAHEVAFGRCLCAWTHPRAWRRAI